MTGTTGNGFATTPGALNQGGGVNRGPVTNVFLSKFSPTGTLLYSAILGDADPQNGGAGPIGADALAVDSSGNAYVAARQAPSGRLPATLTSSRFLARCHTLRPS